MLKAKNNLKNFRKREKMTQQELADLIGISARTLQNYEQGLREPTLEVAKKFADLFMCTIDAIFFEDSHCEMQCENQNSA